MRILKIDPDNPEKDLVLIASNELKKGKILIYPTDTVYGLGCSVDSKNVKRIFKIKGRSMKNPLSVAFSDIGMLKKYVSIDEKEENFIKRNMNEPYTFVVRKKDNIPDIITAGKDTVGVRIPNLRLVREIIRTADTPLITTSANISGKGAPADFDEIDDKIKKGADLLIDSGRCRLGIPSRVVDLRSGRVLRQ